MNNCLEVRPDGLLKVVIEGVCFFPVYAASGGLAVRTISYLIKQGEGPWPEKLIGSDLGLPERDQPFKIYEHERGWRHAAIWGSSFANDPAPLIEAAAQALLNA